jgi:hypothetical protein
LCFPGVAWAQDTIKEKLDLAKEAYTAEIDKYRATVKEWFDKREAEARKEGNKKLLDQIKAEREAFNEKSALPAQAPAALKTQPKTALAKVEKAYETAIAEAIKVKKDDLATLLEKELQELKRQEKLPVAVVADQDRKFWVHAHGYFVKGPGRDWFEKINDGKTQPHQFIEIRRTADYIELQNVILPKVFFRIYKDKAEIQNEKNAPDFRIMYRGTWRELPK